MKGMLTACPASTCNLMISHKAYTRLDFNYPLPCSCQQWAVNSLKDTACWLSYLLALCPARRSC